MTQRRLFLLALLVVLPLLSRAQQPADWSPVAKAMGRDGVDQGGVYKVVFPRTDLRVYVGTLKLEPGAGLVSWAAFHNNGSTTVVDGDLVVLAGEVNEVVGRLQEGGLEITALHNHLANETPAILYLHFFGQGDAVKLASAVKGALGRTRTPTGKMRKLIAPPIPEQKKIEAILGRPGNESNGILAFSFPRQENVTMHQQQMAAGMGLATALNFQLAPTGVAATGDFVLKEDELQRVLKALQESRVGIAAIHNHLMDEQPRLFFVHFWAEGPAEKVAEALKKGLDAASASPPKQVKP